MKVIEKLSLEELKASYRELRMILMEEAEEEDIDVEYKKELIDSIEYTVLSMIHDKKYVEYEYELIEMLLKCNYSEYIECNCCKVEYLEWCNELHLRNIDVDNKIINRYVDMCEYCSNYDTVDEFETVDNLFHNMILSHGLMTGYDDRKSFNEAFDKLEKIYANLSNEDFEICCSYKTQRIGPMGIYVRGHNLVVSNIDLFSVIHDGRRKFKHHDWRSQGGIIYKIEDYDTSKWEHTEHIVVPKKIIGIWIKEWALSDPSIYQHIDVIKHICKDNKLLFHIIKAGK